MEKQKTTKSPLLVIFTTVAMDLIGFGMIVTLTSLYGKELGANAWALGLLAASYSICQFFFAPIWGRLSDRYGRRPILLMSLAGSTLSYLAFGYATLARSFIFLLFSRSFSGVFAANVSAAQAYIADVTPKNKRTEKMGMIIGVSFGIGFILGPALGGISAHRLGLAWPGFIAAGICGLNLCLAWFRLPESLPLKIQLANRKKAKGHYDPLNTRQLVRAFSHPFLGLLLVMFFIQVFAFANIEQTFSLLFQKKFLLDASVAGEKTGLILAFVGLVTILIQGLGLRKIIKWFGEQKMLVIGLGIFALSMASIPFGPSYSSYFLMLIPMAIGRSMVDPSMSGLISKSAGKAVQGETFGLSQGLGSLARATGPFVGLISFDVAYYLPFVTAACLSFIVFLLSLRLLGKKIK